MVEPEHTDNLNYQQGQEEAPLDSKLFCIFFFLSIGQIFTSGLYVNSEYSSQNKEPLDKSELGVIQSVFFMYL